MRTNAAFDVLSFRVGVRNLLRNSGHVTVDAICDSQPLLLLDLRLERELGKIRRELGEAGKKLLATDQRAWVRRRDSCESDLGCLDTAYRERIAELGRGLRKEWIAADAPPVIEEQMAAAPPEAAETVPGPPAPPAIAAPTRSAQTMPAFCDTAAVVSGALTYTFLRKFGAGRDQCLPLLQSSPRPRHREAVNRGIAAVARGFVCESSGKWTARANVELADRELFSVRWAHVAECDGKPARKFDTANTWDLRSGREIALDSLLRKEPAPLKDCPRPGKIEFVMSQGKIQLWSTQCPTKIDIPLAELQDNAISNRLL